MASKSSLLLKSITVKWSKLLAIALLIGFFSFIMAISLKLCTERLEELFFEEAMRHRFLLFVLPTIGLGAIYILRRYLFQGKQNKGIAEVFDNLETDKGLPLYKIPSHFINGFLTVIFGGPTGIEVSTVVASAAVGSIAHHKQNLFKKYRTEMICAGVSSGLTALFNSPLAGILFSVEVLSKKKSPKALLIMAFACLSALCVSHFAGQVNLFDVRVTHWNLYALPYFAVFALFASLNSVYMTKCVLWFKSKSDLFSHPEYKIALAALILGAGLLVLPQLYGDGYHGVKQLFVSSNTAFSVGFFLLLMGLLLLKPLLTAVALWGGGDGGVFAPSLVTGAVSGLLFALVANRFLDAQLIPVNFMLIGMAAVLSATIQAPLTAVFLVCGITGNYVLLLPLLLVSALSEFSARKLYPYTVYTYKKAVA